MKSRVSAAACGIFLLVGFLVLGAVPTAGAQDAPAWPQAMRDARARCQAWRAEQTGGAAVTFGAWNAADPLKVLSFADVAFPEVAVDLEAKGLDGKRLWNRRTDLVDGFTNALPASDGPAVAYLYRVISTPVPVTIKVGLGSDDGLAVWLNGTQLLSQDVARLAAQDSDKLDLPLVAGENKLLLKVFNRIGGCGFYFSFQNDPLAALWDQTARQFPVETAWLTRDTSRETMLAWFTVPDAKDIEKGMIGRALGTTGEVGEPLRQELAALESAAGDDPRWLDLYVKSCKFRANLADFQRVNHAALRLAVADLAKEFPDQYKNAQPLLDRIDACERRVPEIRQALVRNPDEARPAVEETLALQRDALLANPLLDFDRLLLVKRGEGNLGLPQNWQGNCAIPSKGYDNEIAVLSPVRPDGELKTLYKPENGAFVGDVDLNFDADKMLFSMIGSHDRWQIWELLADGTGLRQATAGEEPDVDNYDACYLPDGRITFDSTRAFQGVPCVGGGNTVANFCRMDADGRNTRQLCFDQDHDWCPTVLNNGRLLYTRWEYSDTAHYFTRILFSMNPDGTNQAEYYGSNSYWPNSMFYARPIPNHPSAVVAIVSGHHGVPRMGELVILDPGDGRHEAGGVVQRIPGYGKKVEPVIADTLVDGSWPKFLHPYPLSGKYFLVSCKLTAESSWGLYLVDIFDNMLLIRETPGYALLEPVPFRKAPRPSVIPDKVNLDSKEATVYVADVYRGQGMVGVPRGTVKTMRVFEIYYTYPQMGGHMNVGVEGPWDVHRILGTVPVNGDGSVYFKIPANIPVALQPLDEQGRAVQLMRSWFVGMPGETVSCVGCHERQNTTPPANATQASRQEAADLTPWKGPARGFSFKRDVQPVLDKNCVGCHDGQEKDGRRLPDFTRKDRNGMGNFTPSYLALHPFVRRPGPESDYHVLKAREFGANTSELIQMLEKGHHNVKLDANAWDRLYTWIDLNVPDHGTWGEQHEIPGNFRARRIEMRTLYANRPEDPEIIPELNQEPAAFVAPEPEPAQKKQNFKGGGGWAFDVETAQARQRTLASETKRSVDLGNGVTMDLALIPAGSYVMGSSGETADERPQTKVQVDEAFWMGTVEVTNAQYQQFDPRHDSGFIDQANKDHTTPGYSAQAPNNPVIRISWTEAMAFCRWLSEKTGQTVSLPTEAQWEWACRAGSDAPFWYGDMDADFSKNANLADLSIRLLAVQGINPQPIANPTPFQDFLPKDGRFDDGAKIVTEVAKYQPNPWGLFDMHGNVAEWTLSSCRPYPYADNDGRNAPDDAGKKVVRGGSWFDRPYRATASYRLAYDQWQPVYNVGFRVVVKAANIATVARRQR
jgi:formylglycine-generating enzyme required for sulfatase activity